MTALPNFSCPVYTIGGWCYWKHRYQYATTSEAAAAMSPGVIICPQHPTADEDVKKAIKYAACKNIAIAIRTGGHAYSGTSSTNSNNIQLDLSNAYKDWDYSAAEGTLRVGVSYSLLEFNTKLAEQQLSQLANAGMFMPTGQCYYVHVGGHVQTGGYGQLTRAFGLFSDHIVSFDIILANGTPRKVHRDSPLHDDRELFFAVLGGGPGNYGVMTHVTIRPLKDSDHKHSRAYKRIIPYNPKLQHDVLVQLFDLIREWESAPGDYDFSFTVGSGEDSFIANQIGIASYDDFLVRLSGGMMGSSPFSFLSVYFQYSNLDNKCDSYDPHWCSKIKAIVAAAAAANKGLGCWGRFKHWVEQKLIDYFATKADDDYITPISKCVTTLWTYMGMREFNYPVVKNAQMTDQVADPENWSEWVASRIDELIERSEGLMEVTQCQNFGGQDSAMRKNGCLKQTAYAWRNTTVGYELDAFYNPKVANTRLLAEEWTRVNNDEGIGPDGKLSRADHRWFWASHGDIDMSKVWPFYYSSAEDYERCWKVKKAVDPNGVFSPNPFVVGWPETAPKNAALPSGTA